METIEQPEHITTAGSEKITPEMVDRMNGQAWEVLVEEPERGGLLAQEALGLADQIGYDRGRSYSLGYMGYAHFLQSRYEEAVSSLSQAQTLAEQLDDAFGLGLILGAMANVQTSLGNFDQAFANAFKALDYTRQTGNREMEGWILHGLGMGYHEIGDFERSLTFYKESLELFEESANTRGIARALNGVGSVYQRLGKYDQALEYHRKSLELFDREQNTLGEARALSDIGIIYQQQGRLDDAQAHHEKSLGLREQIGNRQAQSTSLLQLGEVFREREDISSALDYFNRALTIASEIKSKPRVYQAHEALADLYEQLDDPVNALFHHKAFHQVKEEVFGEEANAKMANLRISVEVEQAEKEAEMTRQHNVTLQTKNEQLEEILKDLQETQSHLIQSEKMAALGTVVAGVVHEMNTPLGAINSGIDVMKRCVDNILSALAILGNIEELETQPQFSRSIKLLEETGNNAVSASERITRILSSLRSFTRLDESSYQRVDLHEGLEAALTLLEHDLKDRIRIDRQYGDLPPIPSYPGELNQAFMNLLLNAAEAMGDTGTVTIQSYVEDGYAHICISDTGIGISREHLATIFVPNFTRDGARVKAGMGLFTVYNIIQKHQGYIDVDSVVGEGTTFSIRLPVNAPNPPMVKTS